MKLSKSEAGKLNTTKSIEISKFKKEKRIFVYLENPKLCLNCESKIPYEKRQNKFCSQSCGAIYTNAKKDWSKIITGPTPIKYKNISRKDLIKHTQKKCDNCDNIIKSSSKNYCSIKCQSDFKYNKRVEEWKSGISAPRNTIKKYLKQTFGDKCSVCGINEWNNKKINLDLEHKDGNSDNNKPENLCLICPNCHSQTDTYKGKNKGNGRHNRRQRYKEGKSF
jgi:hypothetical protein